MKESTLADVITALPAGAAVAGIRAYILHAGLEGNLEDAARAFEQLWECEGYEETKAELTEFLVARYAYRGDREMARKLYARFASLGTTAATLQAQAAALHILVFMLMEVKLEAAIRLWRGYVRLPIPPRFKKLSAHAGLAALRQALKTSDSRSARVAVSALCALARETGDKEIAIRAKKIFEKGQP